MRHSLRYWSEDEVKYVEEHAEKESSKTIALSLGRPWQSVSAKITRLRRGVRDFKAGTFWTKERLAYLRDNYRIRNKYWLADALGVTPTAIKSAIASYGITKTDSAPRPEKLTQAQLGYIAGLIDADGSILIVKGHKGEYGTYLRPFCCVATMAEHEAPLRVFGWLRMVGFAAGLRLSKRRGKHRDVSDLILRRQNEVVFLLEAVKPYLIAKQASAEILISFCKATTQEQKWTLYRELSARIPLSAQRRKYSREFALGGVLTKPLDAKSSEGELV